MPVLMSQRTIWRVLFVAFAIELLSLTLNCIELPAYILTRSFNLDGEANIPTWFSSVQLFVMGCVALLCLCMEFYNNQRGKLFGWLFLTLIFWSLSLDEVATLHELTAKAIAHHYELHAFRIRGFVWVYMLAPFAFFAAVYMAYFFYRRFCKEKRSFYLSAAGLILWTTVLPLEYAGGRFADIHIEFWKSYTYKIMTNVEEIAEMAGATLILAGLLFYLDYIAEKREGEMEL